MQVQYNAEHGITPQSVIKGLRDLTDRVEAETLPRAAAVRVDVFDVLGRRVTTLAGGLQPPGPHRLALDAIDLPPGLLLIRLTADGVVYTQQVMHLR